MKTHHNDVIKWKHFPHCWPFVRGIHRSLLNSPQKASDAELRYFLWSEQTVGQIIKIVIRHLAHYDIIVMLALKFNLLCAKYHGSMMLRYMLNT